MEKDNEVNEGQQGREESAGVVEQRRRRAPGVVIGDESGEAAVASPAEVPNSEQVEANDEVVGAADPGSAKPARKRRAGARKAEVPEVHERAEEVEAAAVSEALSATEAEENENQPSTKQQDGEPARKRRRSRRSGGAKTAGEEAVLPDLGDLDGAELSEKSWELFSREVQENGMEIVDDREARKFAVRSVEIARIYLQERARLIPGGK